METTTGKGTNFLPNTPLPVVLLAADQTPDGHKRPIERGWPSRTPTLAEVMRHVGGGGGVGVNLAKSKSVSAIDIDERTPSADAIAERLGRAGALVCRTLRGWHIYIRRSDKLPPPGRYRLVVEGHEAVVEWHPGGGVDVRQLVLPVLGTPRVALGGGVYWVGGQAWTGVGMELQALLQAFAALPDLTHQLRFEPLTQQAQPVRAGGRKEKEGGEGVIDRVVGKKNASLEDVLSAVRAAPPAQGERHNYFVPLAAAVWRKWGYVGVRRLEGVMWEVWGGEADEREIFDIIQSAMLKFESNASSKKSSLDDVVEKLLSRQARWLMRDGEEFLVVEGWAVAAERLWEWLVGQGEVVGKTTAEAVVARLREALPAVDDDVVIVTESPRRRGDSVYVLIEGGKVLEALPAGLSLHDTPPAGVVRRWGAKAGRRYRKGELSELVEVVGRLTQRDGAAMLAVLAPIVTGLAHGVLIVEGDSGAGKSTLNKFLQALANSATFTTMSMGRDVRDWVAVCRSRLVVGHDETQPSGEMLDFVRSCTTGGATSVRKLYTTADSVTYKLHNSFIFSAVAYEDVPGDVARRAVALRLVRPAGRVDLTEEEFAEMLEKESDELFFALFELLPNVLQHLRRDDGRRLVQALAGVKADSLAPAWAREDSKADWAQAAWAFGEVLGCAGAVEELWKELRAAAADKGLRLWGDVVQLYEERDEFRERVRVGMLAVDIAKELTEDATKHRSLAIALSRQAPAVRPALRALGYELEIEEGTSKSRNKRKLFRLRKRDDAPPPPPAGGPGGHGAPGGADGGGSPSRPAPRAAGTGTPSAAAPAATQPTSEPHGTQDAGPQGGQELGGAVPGAVTAITGDWGNGRRPLFVFTNQRVMGRVLTPGRDEWGRRLQGQVVCDGCGAVFQFAATKEDYLAAYKAFEAHVCEQSNQRAYEEPAF